MEGSTASERQQQYTSLIVFLHGNGILLDVEYLQASHGFYLIRYKERLRGQNQAELAQLGDATKLGDATSDRINKFVYRSSKVIGPLVWIQMHCNGEITGHLNQKGSVHYSLSTSLQSLFSMPMLKA